jgi:D-serine deaminase-like pyridoxal phosphate-dependent protein
LIENPSAVKEGEILAAERMEPVTLPSRASPPALPTPFALADQARLMRNLERMQLLAARHGVTLRPHVKTHKTPEIAALQLGLGASGLTASKPSEAIHFMTSGAPSVLLAFPIVAASAARAVIEASQRSGTDLSFILDSTAGCAALNEAGREAGRTLPVQIKVDVGLGRCGVASTSETLITLAKAVAASPHLELTGLLSHAGHGYRANHTDELRDIAEDERRQILHARDRLDFLKQPLKLSVGSTPTVLAGVDFREIDEIRPGNYALFDLTAERLGIAQEDEIAFGIVATIVSRNADFYIIDAGSKALSSDLGPHSSAGLQGYGRAIAIDEPESELRFTVLKLSEEHGFVSRSGTDLAIGSRLLVLPNHSCAVINLYERLVVQKAAEVEFWPVAARGALT